MTRKNYQRGATLVEAVVAVSVFLVVVLSLSGVITFSMKAVLENATKVQAGFLAEEGLEAVRLMRDAGWTANIAGQSSGTPFYLEFNGAAWTATETSTTIEGIFERQVVFADVYRDFSQNIVSSGGTLDPNIRKVTVEVSWLSAGATTTRALSTYLANVFND